MSFMLEVYYRGPENPTRKKKLCDLVAGLGGKLSCRELPGLAATEAICLTFEFENNELANNAAATLRLEKEHVEGPCDY